MSADPTPSQEGDEEEVDPTTVEVTLTIQNSRLGSSSKVETDG
jgi:hypothetical protein